MNDVVIREALVSLLTKTKEDPTTIVVSEMGLSEGRSIIDVATINGVMSGYEIKSDVDSLYRLDRQIATYQQFFQKLTIVTTKKHLAKIRMNYPAWIGLMLAYEVDGIVMIRQLRKPKLNRRTNNRDITTLLWRDEARMALKGRGVTGISSATRSILWDKMSQIHSQEELIAVVKTSMRSRRAWQVVG